MGVMAFSLPSQSSNLLLNPPPSSSSSSFPFLSLQHRTLLKTLRFKPCCSHITQTPAETKQPRLVKIDIEVRKKRRKPKPSFYEQIREKWSQKPLSLTQKLPWQQQQKQEEAEEEEPSSQVEAPLEMVSDAESSDLESPKVFGQLINRSEIEEPTFYSERNSHQTLSNAASDPVGSGLGNILIYAPFTPGDKATYTHFDHETKSDRNYDLGVFGDLANDFPIEDLDIIEEVEPSGKMEGVQAEKSTLITRKFDIQSGVSLSDNFDSIKTKRDKFSFDGSAQQRIVNSLPWMLNNNEDEKPKRRKTDLAEKTIPEHELKRLRNLALRMKERFKVGAAGVTQALVGTIHEKWKIDEVVKLKFEGPPAFNMKRIHEVLESKTGGFVIWRSGSSVVLYRGLTYRLGSVQTYVSKKGVNVDILRNPEKSLPDTLRLPKDLSKEELMEVSELNNILDELGPRYKDWSGCPPLPVDADLLPGLIPGYKTPFRSLPYGERRCLRDVETTHLRRLARNMPPHFALGRNRELQGLAAAIVKLWQRSAIAKIAIKRGVLNTNNERMAEQLKKLTGGTLLSRNKEYIVFYRGNDFLSPSVTDALKERERMITLQHQEEEARLHASILINPIAKYCKTPMVAGTLAETVAATLHWGKQPSTEEVEKMLKDSAMARHASLVRYLEKKLAMAKGKMKKAEKALAKVQESLEPAELPTDLETITDEERLVYRKMGLSMKPYLLLGRREVFDGTIENMHMHWKFRELVKIIVKEKHLAQVKHIAVSLEAESGGILVCIEKTTKGYAIILYRGKNYQRPLKLKPGNLLTRRQALARSIELQRREGLKHHISSLEEQIELLKSGLEDMKDGNEIDGKTFYEILDDPSIPSDDDTEEDEGEEYYL